MSHFSVLVVTKDQTKETLSKALLPYHEYECTGIEDYTVWVDHTEEIQKGWEELPAEKREEYGYKSIEDYARDYHGCEKTFPTKAEPRYGRRTNPNKQWDWYKVGGRYSNLLINKAGEVGDSEQWKELDMARMHQDRIEGRRRSIYDTALRAEKSVEEFCRIWDEQKPEYDRLNAEWKAGKEGRRWELFASKLTQSTFQLWQWLFDDWRGLDGDTPHPTVKHYIDNPPALSSWAVLDLDGKWHERADMGWWGMYCNEDEKWEKETFPALLSKIEPDHFVTIVDCHI